MGILKDLTVLGASRFIGNAYFTNITANLFIKSGGTSSLFLKADGSVDSNTYLTLTSFGTNNPDLSAIEALTGTSGFLKKTAANTWSLDTSTYLTTSSAANTYYALNGSNTGTKLSISVLSAAYTDGICFMNNTTKKGNIGCDTNGALGIYAASKVTLRPILDLANKGVEVTTTAMYPTDSITLGTSTAANKWSTVYATTYDGSILKLHQGDAANPSLTSNARIEFDYGAGLPVVISYTPNDSYRNPAGLKVMGGTSATPAWFEVEGNIYAAGFNGSGASLTNLNGSNISTGTVADARIASSIARLASPTFTGTPAAPTATAGTNTTQIATTAFVQTAVNNKVHYVANLQAGTAANYITEPEVKTVKINGSTTNSASTTNCVLQFDTTNQCLKFVFN